jgi:iron complex transport system substrate-binding protein
MRKSCKYRIFEWLGDSRTLPASLIFLLAAGTIACVPQTSREKSENRADSSGNTNAETTTVMALSPALTEQLFFLFPPERIAAVSQACNFPPETSEKPKIQTYPLDIEQVLALRPGLLVTETGMTQPQDIARLRRFGIPVRVMQYRKTEDILNGMDTLARNLRALPEAMTRLRSLRDTLTRLGQESAATTSRPTILVVTWTDPVFAYGYETWISDKIWLAGGKNVLTRALDKPYPVLQRETILSLNPDIIMGKSFEEMDRVFFSRYPELKTIRAYRTKSVFAFDDDLMSRPGPRFAESVREIQRCIMLHNSRKEGRIPAS